MAKRNTIEAYSALSKTFHWLIACIVIAMLAGSFFLGSLPLAQQPLAYLIHKSLGLTVLFLMLGRLVWLYYRGRPDLPETVPAWQKILSKVVQYSLYVFLIVMPVSGWIMSMAANKTPSYFGLFHLSFPGITPDKALATLMNQSHKAIAWVLIVLIILHIAGALKHYFINQDGVLQRMLPDCCAKKACDTKSELPPSYDFQ